MRTAILREVWFDQVWRVHACLVVADTDEAIALYSPPGAMMRFPVDDAGREVRIPAPTGWTYAERRGRMHALRLYRPSARYSIWLFWDADWTFVHWYVNFEQPNERTSLGWDYRDDKLDLIVNADGSVTWKDEDELAEAARLGLVEEPAVRAEAERVLAEPPWPTGWEDWRWGRSAPAPVLPVGWDVV